ncbi:MAG: DNA replication/repair protein RecF [Lachnospiraceae bacterium]|nr:DNA replication/repair protein RecF [Lachnospiraceae bacterium]
MYVESIELSDYRNYKTLNIDFDSSTNILYGDNAQGKTNVLESIYVCGTAKSHRGSKDKEIIRFNCDESHIKMFIRKDGISQRIDMHLKKSKPKGIAVNGVPIRKVSELLGLINIIFFSPEDLNIIKNGPSERRKFIDLELCQLDKIYLHNLMKYNKVLEQRNKLLKEIHFKNDSFLADTLDVWDMQLTEYGIKIIKTREEFINNINEIIYKIHKNLSGGKEELTILYEPNILKDDFLEKLKNNREKDISIKSTSIGPHRDDMGFYIKGIDVRKYGSQGQQRTCALSLKMAEIEIVKDLIKDVPVLLLDDVMSELDSNRQNHLLDSLNGIQTIITCTGLDEFIESRINAKRIYKVENGKCEKKI